MGSSLNEAIVQKKLESLQPSQESIETVSLWCLHHKDYHSMIVNVWIKCYKTVTLKQRLSLIYLANDVCQRERQKKFSGFRKSFVTVLKEAITIVRSDEIRTNVERIVDIWKERDIFDGEFVNELKSILQNPNSVSVNNDKSAPSAVINEKWLAEFKLDALIVELDRLKQEKLNLQRTQSLLPNVPFSSDGNVKSYLKDRQEGLKYAKEIDLAHKKLSDFVGDLEKQLQGQSKLIGLLEQAKIFYETQLAEANIVETAYRKFGSGIQLVKQELDKMKASGLFPQNESPPRDAPSPSPNEDPFAAGVEAVAAGKIKQKNFDRHELEDMELDDEGPTTSKTSKLYETTVEGLGLKVTTNRSFMTSNGKIPEAAPKFQTPLSEIPIPPSSGWLRNQFYQQPNNVAASAAPPQTRPSPVAAHHPSAYVYDHTPQSLPPATAGMQPMTFNYDHTKLKPPIQFDISSPPPRLPPPPQNATATVQRTFNFHSPPPSQSQTRFSLPTAAAAPASYLAAEQASLDKTEVVQPVRGINQRNLTVLSGGGDEPRFRNPPLPQRFSAADSNSSGILRAPPRLPAVKTGWPQMQSAGRFSSQPPPKSFQDQRLRQPSWQQQGMH